MVQWPKVEIWEQKHQKAGNSETSEIPHQTRFITKIAIRDE